MKRILAWVCLVMLCFGLSVPVAALDVERECSLSLLFAKDGQGFGGETISLYQVASAESDGTFHKTAPFDAYPVSIYNITDPKGWSDLAHTLSGYITADSLDAISTTTTDASGAVRFLHLPTGLYLVDGITAVGEDGTYTFDPFMVYLPTQYDDTYEYDVVAKPKADRFEPVPVGTEYRVLKLWEDTGYTDQRPASVKVEIHKDGALFETVTLSSANDWSYAWTDSGQSTWSVVERDIPEGYRVFVDQNATTFILTNQWHPDTPDGPNPPVNPPDTGDTSPIWLYVVVLCLSGLGLMVVGVALLRGTRDEKKHQ